MTLIANALTTLARQKVYQGITKTTNDTLLSTLVGAVSTYLKNSYCHRNFKRQTFTQELHSGQGSEAIYLKNYPVVAGETVTLQHKLTTKNDSDDWETVDSENYFVDNDTGRVTLSGGFKEGVQNYRITYTAGYYLPQDAGWVDGADASLPTDLEFAVWAIVTNSYQRRKSRGTKSERVRDVSISYLQSINEDSEIKAILDQYRRISYR